MASTSGGGAGAPPVQQGDSQGQGGQAQHKGRARRVWDTTKRTLQGAAQRTQQGRRADPRARQAASGDDEAPGGDADAAASGDDAPQRLRGGAGAASSSAHGCLLHTFERKIRPELQVPLAADERMKRWLDKPRAQCATSLAAKGSGQRSMHTRAAKGRACRASISMKGSDLAKGLLECAGGKVDALGPAATNGDALGVLRPLMYAFIGQALTATATTWEKSAVDPETLGTVQVAKFQDPASLAQAMGDMDAAITRLQDVSQVKQGRRDYPVMLVLTQMEDLMVDTDFSFGSATNPLTPESRPALLTTALGDALSACVGLCASLRPVLSGSPSFAAQVFQLGQQLSILEPVLRPDLSTPEDVARLLRCFLSTSQLPEAFFKRTCHRLAGPWVLSPWFVEHVMELASDVSEPGRVTQQDWEDALEATFKQFSTQTAKALGLRDLALVHRMNEALAAFAFTDQLGGRRSQDNKTLVFDRGALPDDVLRKWDICGALALSQNGNTISIGVPFPFLMDFFKERAGCMDWADRQQVYNMFNGGASQWAMYVGVIYQYLVAAELTDQKSPLYPRIAAAFKPNFNLVPVEVLPPVAAFVKPSEIDGKVEKENIVRSCVDLPTEGRETRDTDVSLSMYDKIRQERRAIKAEVKFGAPDVKSKSGQNRDLRQKRVEFFQKAVDKSQTAKTVTLNLYVCAVKLAFTKMTKKKVTWTSWGWELWQAIKLPENALLDGPEFTEGCKQPFDLCCKIRWESMTDFSRWQAGIRAAFPRAYLRPDLDEA